MDTQVIKSALLVVLISSPLGLAQSNPDSGKLSAKDNFVEQSSRKLLDEQKMSWIAEMRTKLPMARRQVGPFGLQQDPSVKIVHKQKVKAKPGAFLNAIKAMKINTVIASERKFAIGAREFRSGDAFPVIRGQRQFNIKILSVRSDHIVFQDVDTGKRVRRNLNALPPGVSRNSSIDSVPGVIPASKKDASPLNLDATTLPTSTNKQH